MTNFQRGALFGLGAALCWASYLVLSRIGATQGLDGLDISAIRYGIAALIMLPFALRRSGPDRPRLGMGRILLLTSMAGPPFVLLGVGAFQYAPLAHGAVLQPSSLSLGGMVLGALVLNESLSRARILGALVIVCGLAMIAGPGLFSVGRLTPVGDVMFMAAGWMWAGFSTLVRRWRIKAAQATAVISVASAVLVVPAWWLFSGPDHILAQSWGMIALLLVVHGVLVGVGAVFAFASAVQLMGVSRAAIFPALVPGMAILLGIPTTGEVPNLLQIAGLVTVTIGMLVAFEVLKPRTTAAPINP